MRLVTGRECQSKYDISRMSLRLRFFYQSKVTCPLTSGLVISHCSANRSLIYFGKRLRRSGSVGKVNSHLLFNACLMSIDSTKNLTLDMTLVVGNIG